MAAQYSSSPAPTELCQTCYVSVDHLGTTRLVTDQLANVIARHDFTPFGQEITSGWAGRGQQWGVGDGVAQKFTGKERDQESGLDYFDARYYGTALGRFTSPDDFWKDSHIADPQSWNKYAYARNNPLRYTDPTGEEATVSTSCTTDSNNHTTCNVKISASIAIYATSGSGLTSGDLNSAASTIKNSIQTAWSGSFSQDGVSYNVSTDVCVSVASSQSAAMKSGAQNVIGISNGDAIPGVADSYVNPRSLGAAITGGPDTGIWNFNNVGTGVAAHEFTHLLGVDDRTSGAVLSNTNCLNDPSIPHATTPSDLLWGSRKRHRASIFGEMLPRTAICATARSGTNRRPIVIKQR